MAAQWCPRIVGAKLKWLLIAAPTRDSAAMASADQPDLFGSLEPDPAAAAARPVAAHQPPAARMRPRTLAGSVGQAHIT